MDAGELFRDLRARARAPKGFYLREWLGDPEHDRYQRALYHLLSRDNRFLLVGEQSPGDTIVVPRAALFRRLLNLSLRLSRAQVSTLTACQFAKFLSGLHPDGSWELPPPAILEFGKRYGFAAPAWTEGHYVFPLARVLSVLPFAREKACEHYKRLAKEGRADITSEVSLQQLLTTASSAFGPRTIDVIVRREGLLTGTKETLQQIGSELEVSRERVRQLESRFWEVISRKKKWQDLFLEAFLRSLFLRKGSLLVDSRPSSIRFLAKCVGVPQYRVPHTRLVILTMRPEEAREFPSPRKLVGLTLAEFVDKLLLPSVSFLSAEDIQCLGEQISSFYHKRLNSAQRVLYVLQLIGHPVHYSEIAKKHNEIFPGHAMDERAVLAVLARGPLGIVWTGVRGIYALEQWGYRRPSKTLVAMVTEIVEVCYAQTGRPVPLSTIMAELGKHRKIVKHASVVFALQLSPGVRRVAKDLFVPQSCDLEAPEDQAADDLDRALREFENR